MARSAFAYEWQFLSGELVDSSVKSSDTSSEGPQAVAGYWMP